jgi:hypothetical protein
MSLESETSPIFKYFLRTRKLRDSEASLLEIESRDASKRKVTEEREREWIFMNNNEFLVQLSPPSAIPLSKSEKITRVE